MLRHSRCYALFFLATCTALNAHASPINANVLPGSVGRAGMLGLEYRPSYELDSESDTADGRFTERLDFFYNPSNRVQLRTFLTREKRSGENFDLTNWFIEPAFQLFNQDQHGFDGSLITGLSLAEGDNTPHFGYIILAAEYQQGSWSYRHNSFIGHQFGPDASSGLRYEARWMALRRIHPSLRLGAEMYNDFGNVRELRGYHRQSHRAGPVMLGSLGHGLGFEAGVQRGLNLDQSDWAGKFWLNYVF